MSVAEVYGSNSDTASDLSLGALDDLASSSAEVQAEVERRIAAGGIVSAADVKRIKYFFIGLRRKQFPGQEVILARCEVTLKRLPVNLAFVDSWVHVGIPYADLSRVLQGASRRDAKAPAG
jgi:hypothetical protein